MWLSCRRAEFQQVATPQALYERPVNEFVAGFIGSPSINMIEAELMRSDGRLSVAFGGHELAIPEKLAGSHSALERFVGRAVLLGIRPEDLEDASLDSGSPPDRRLTVTCDYTEPLGADVLVYFTVSAPAVITGTAPDADPALGAPGARHYGRAPDSSRESIPEPG